MEDTLERWWRLGSWQGERLRDAASPRRSPPSDAATAVPLPSGGGPWVPGAADPPRRRGHPTASLLLPAQAPSAFAITVVLTAWNALGSGSSFLISWKRLCGTRTISS